MRDSQSVDFACQESWRHGWPDLRSLPSEQPSQDDACYESIGPDGGRASCTLMPSRGEDARYAVRLQFQLDILTVQ